MDLAKFNSGVDSCRKQLGRRTMIRFVPLVFMTVIFGISLVSAFFADYGPSRTGDLRFLAALLAATWIAQFFGLLQKLIEERESEK
jgi:hypothetical protein